jgi:four helix bundle protein
MTVKNYRSLEVWQKGMDLVEECYRLCSAFPKSETYGLSSQLKRAAVSVPANIAEGQARQHRPEFIQHLYIAYGSLAEIETHVQIAVRLNFVQDVDAQPVLERCGEVGRLLNGLLRSLRNTDQHSTVYRASTTDHRQPTTDHRQR